MADNVSITAGSGTNIATDDNSTAHEQVVKVDLGKNGTFTGYVGGEGTNDSHFAMFVVARPKVLDSGAINSSSLTTASTSYTAGDTLGAGWTITNAGRASGATGRVTGVLLYDIADVTTSVTIYFADSSITFGTDNSAPGISDGDTDNLVGAVTVGMADLGGARFGSQDSLSIPYTTSGGTSLYAYAVTNTDHTFFGAATDLKLRVFCELD